MRIPRSGLALGVTLLAACGGGDDPAPEQAAADSAIAAPAAPVTTTVDSTAQAMGEDTGGAASMLVTLAAVGGSSATGTATIHGDAQGGGQGSVEVAVSGAPASEALPAHIHRGRCGSDQGVAMPLGEIGTVEDGSGSSSTSVNTSILAGGDVYVQVHGPGGAPILCGDIPRG